MNNRFKNLDWLAVVIYPLFVVLMEAFWVYPWLVWLGSLSVFTQPRPPLNLVSVIIVLAAAVLAVRYFLRPRWPVRLAQAIIVGGGLVVVLLVLRAEYGSGYGFLSGKWFVHIGQVLGNAFAHPETIVIALPALLYLWWRGINLGQATSYFRSIYNSFVIGMVALVVLMIIWQIGASSGDFPAPGTGTGLDIIAFFFFGLMAIAVTHLYQMRGAMPREEAGMTSVWRWLPTMLVVIGVLVMVGFGIAGIFSSGFFESVGHGFGAVSHFFGKIIDYIAVPLNYLFEGVIWILRLLINLLRGSQSQQPNSTGNTTLTDVFPKVTPADVPQVIYLVIKWLIIAAIVAAVIYILARAVSRYRARRAQEEIEQLDESLLSWSNLNDDLRAFLAMMAGKLRRKQSPAAGAHYHDDESGRLNIREIYWRLLREASLSGLSRGLHETPTEYSARLRRAMPAGSDSIVRLTDMYVDVRYGDTVPPEEKVTSANGLWRMLRALLMAMRGK